MRFAIPHFAGSMPVTPPHPTAIKLGQMVHEKVAEAMQLMGAIQLGDKNTVKRILGLSDAGLRANGLRVIAAYMRGTRAQVEAAVAAAEAVQSQAAAKSGAMHGYGDATATQNANAALATADPASASQIVAVVQQKGRPPLWKFLAAGAGAYALYRGVKQKPVLGFKGFGSFGDAGLVSGPVLLGAAALVPLLFHKDSLPPPPPATGGGSSDPLSDVQGIVGDGQKIVAAGGAIAGVAGATGMSGVLGPALAAAAPALGVGGAIAAGLAVDALGTKVLADKVGAPAAIAISVGTGMMAPMLVGADTVVSTVANKIAPLIGISGSEGSVVSSVSAGTMVRRDSGDTSAVFLTDSNGQKHHITNMDTVNALGGDVVRMVAANVDAMPNGFDVGSGAMGLAIRHGTVLAPSTMIRRDSGDTSSIYITDDAGEKHHITDMGYVDARGGPGAVITLAAATVDTIPNGPDVGSVQGPVIPPPPPPPPPAVVAAIVAPPALAAAAPPPPPLPVPAGSMIRRQWGDTQSIYMMDGDGVKHHVRSMDYVNGHGGTGAVRGLPAPVVDSMPTGSEVG